MKKYIRDYLTLFSIAGTIIFLDQLTKYLVRANLAFSEIYPQGNPITEYVRIIHWRNTGAAFGLFQNLGLVFTILSFVVGVVIIYYFPRVPREEWLLRLAMCLQLGGAMGNLIDRLHQGHVTDFISVWNFPVFNIADASISLGVAILFFGLIDQERRQAANKESETPVEEISPTGEQL